MISCKKANETDLVDYLHKLGYAPTKISHNDYWYLSPLREEKHASFKVNRKLNLWFDHGTGNGGNMVDFGTAFYSCSVREFLSKLSSESLDISFHRHLAGEKKKVEEESKIKILKAGEIVSDSLIQYLKKRSIDDFLARKYCKEISFELYNKKYNSIGFQNSNGGWELRSESFKGSSAPKAVRLIEQNEVEKGTKTLLVFEGFFSFLSYKTLAQKWNLNERPLTSGQENFLILNSLSFFDKSRTLMEKHQSIHLYLDRDKPGMKFTERALSWSQKYKDQSQLYKQQKDLNEYLQQVLKPSQKQSLRQGRHF